MARSSGLPPIEVEIAVEEILDRIIAMTASDNPPDYPFAMARVAMRRLPRKDPGVRMRILPQRAAGDGGSRSPHCLGISQPVKKSGAP